MVSTVPPDLSMLSPVIRSILNLSDGVPREMPLVPDAPFGCPQLDKLRSLTAEDLFDGEPIVSQDYAECVRSGMFLRFSALDESHRISQGIGTSSGSYWHGIMHRQEGDWSNAKYWFRRTGTHPVMAELERETGAPWDPFGFVDACSAASRGHGDRSRASELQMLEWQLLMNHCYQKALGR